MRIWPPLETRTRKQRIPVVEDVAQVPPVGLLMLISIFPAGTGVTRPRPLKMMVDCPAATTALSVPSAAGRTWTMRGATVSEGGVLQAALGSSRLTTQLPLAVDNAQEPVTLEVNWKRTVALRRTASARARKSPFWMASAEVRIWEFWIQLKKLGAPMANNKATIANPISNSTRVVPRCWGFSLNTPPPSWSPSRWRWWSNPPEPQQSPWNCFGRWCMQILPCCPCQPLAACS